MGCAQLCCTSTFGIKANHALRPHLGNTHPATASFALEIVLMTDASDIPTLSFEQALAELESIVRALESGQAPLEQSIQNYERGAALKAHCEAKLAAARLRVEKIVLSASGEPSAVQAADFG